MDVFSVFTEIWALRALVASGLVGIMCGALGVFIVLRNMSLIGDALSHAILPGVVLAFVVVQQYSSLGFFVGAVLAGLFSAFGITWIQQNVNTKNDAAIGIVFTAMFSLGVIGISWISRGQGVHLDLKDFLFGNVLTVSDEDLVLTASVTVFVLLSITVFYRYLFISTFQEVIARTMGISVGMIHYFLMLLLSFAVVASLQTVGVILVVAMLITPASTALLLSTQLRNVIILSSLIGLLAAVAGLFFSILWETTPGPAMAVAATVIYLLAALFAPRKGVIAKYRARVKQQNRVLLEDLVKHAFKLQRTGNLSTGALSAATGISGRKFRHLIHRLLRDDLLGLAGAELVITEAGRRKANSLIRAHRLWETYLVDQVGLTSDQIHEDAEIYEHHLTEDILDEVERELGYPSTDPHGSPIPPKGNRIDYPLIRLEPGEEARISSEQPDPQVTVMLWKVGLSPNEPIRMRSKSEREIVIDTPAGEVVLDPAASGRINVLKAAYSS